MQQASSPAFEAYIYQRCATEIASWRDPASGIDCADVYLISFCIDDAGEPTFAFHASLWLSYNTETQWRAQISAASGAGEARWNLPFWTADYRLIIPEDTSITDPQANDKAVRQRDAWLSELGLTLPQQPLDLQYDTQAEWDAFVPLCARVARRLHDAGVVAATFGRTIPILIHDLDDSDAVTRYTSEANPPGTARDYEDYALAELGGFFSKVAPDAQAGYGWTAQQVWEIVAQRCRDNPFIRDGLRRWEAAGRLAGAGIWDRACWGQEGLTVPWDDAPARGDLP